VIMKHRNYGRGFVDKEELLYFISNLDQRQTVEMVGRHGWRFPKTIELNARFIQIATQEDGILIPRGRTSDLVGGEEGQQKYYVGSKVEGRTDNLISISSRWRGENELIQVKI
jgi:hypothetical protein